MTDMKICVFSDSHGSAGPMISAIGREKPDLCFFLGDGERDLSAVQACYPSLPIYAVRGNCDLRSKLSALLVCTVGGVRIFAVHGHQYNVKYEPNLETLADAARNAEASIALFGHTHHSQMAQEDGLLFLNPGTIGRVPHPSYGLLELDDGKARGRLATL